LTPFRRLHNPAEIVAGIFGEVLADRVNFFDERIFRHTSSFESSIGVQMIGGANPAEE
jgi:hypothetical protein